MNHKDRVTVWVDGQVFENQHQIGIWRIFYEVLRRAPASQRVVLWLRDRPVQPIPVGVRVVRDRGRIPARRWDVVARARRKFNRLRVPQELRRAEVFHATYFARCPTPEPAMVTTVYDMIAEDRGMLSDVWADHVARKRDAILAASRIIAISHATRADLIRFYPQVEDRVRVVPLAADHLLGPDEMGRQSERSGRGERYAVFVGQRADYKNFRVVLEAMLEPAWPRGLRLHVVGAPLTELEKMWIDRHCLSDRVRYVGRLTDAQLREQYKSAECLIFPSLIEGFGIPVLEAQLCGCPAVLSDIPVFREIAGATAVFFDPRLSERLAEAVAAIGEPEIRRQLVGTGLANVRRFSWSQAAEQWFEVHGEAARGEGAPG